MKKFLMIAVMAMSALTMSAQGKMAVGANVNLGIFSNSHTCMGFGAKFQYEFIQNLRGEAGFAHGFESNVTTVGLNVGAAGEYQISDSFKLGLDVYYKHARKNGGDLSCGLVIAATAAYCF